MSSTRRHPETGITAMRAAFERALYRWAVTHPYAQVAIPTGVVNGNELLRVMMAIERARTEGGAAE